MRSIRLLFPALLALLACAVTPAPAPATPAAAPTIRNTDSRAGPVLAIAAVDSTSAERLTAGPPATAHDASVVRGSFHTVMQEGNRGENIQGLERRIVLTQLEQLEGSHRNRYDTRYVRHEHEGNAQDVHVDKDLDRSRAGRRGGASSPAAR